MENCKIYDIYVMETGTEYKCLYKRKLVAKIISRVGYMDGDVRPIDE